MYCDYVNKNVILINEWCFFFVFSQQLLSLFICTLKRKFQCCNKFTAISEVLMLVD